MKFLKCKDSDINYSHESQAASGEPSNAALLTLILEDELVYPEHILPIEEPPHHVITDFGENIGHATDPWDPTQKRPF
jgi:hypothetical protein